MKCSFALILVVCVCTTLTLRAQAGDAKDYYGFRNSIGLNFSSTTGSGLSFAHRFGDMLHVKAIGYYYLSENGENKNSIGNAALELQYDVLRDLVFDNGIRVFFSASARYYNEENSKVNYSYYLGQVFVDTTMAQSNFINSYNIGLGAELIISHRVTIGVQMGYGYREERLYPEILNQISDRPQYPKHEILPTIGFDIGFLF